MKPQNWRNLNRNELPEFPASTERLIGPVNRQFEEVTRLLQGRIGTDNLDQDGRLISVKHGVENFIKLKTSQMPVAGAVVFADNYPKRMPELSWAMAGEKRVRFTCYFRDAAGAVDPTGTANVRLEFRV